MPIQILTTLGTNTGKTVGDVRMGRPKHLLLTRGKEFTADQIADSASFQTALAEAMLEARTSNSKVFLFSNFREAEDNTGDPQMGTLSDGYEEVLNEVVPKYTFRQVLGAAQTQSIVDFNGWQEKIYVIDDKNQLWFIHTSTSGAKGYSVGHLYTNPPRFGNSGNINTNVTRLTFGSVEEFKSNTGVLKLDFSVEDLANIVDVQLSEVGAASGYVFKIGAKYKYAGVNVFSDFATALEQSDAWKATRMDTGADVTISAVADNTTTKGWDVTLASTPTIAVGTKIKIELQAPSLLAGLTTPVEGIESIYVIVTKAA